MKFGAYGLITVVALTLVALQGAMQAGAGVKAGPTSLTYPHAVACAGVLRAQPGPARTGVVSRAVWTFAMAAGELGRNKGLSPDAIERAIKQAEARARATAVSVRNAQARECVLEARNSSQTKSG